jgi:hypothetical protein
MDPEGSMPHSQGLSNNSYPEPNQPKLPALIPIPSSSILILSSHLRLGLPKGILVFKNASKTNNLIIIHIIYLYVIVGKITLEFELK